MGDDGVDEEEEVLPFPRGAMFPALAGEEEEESSRPLFSPPYPSASEDSHPFRLMKSNGIPGPGEEKKKKKRIRTD